jgi:hypothetical protein
MTRRDDGKDERKHPRDAAAEGGEERGAGPGERSGDREEVEVAAADLVAALARLDLEAALAHEEAATHCSDEDLARKLRELGRDHRAHAEALNEALEAEEQAAVAPPQGAPVLAGLAIITGPLGDEVTVVTALGHEQLTSLAYDAALSYEWDDESEAMLRRFQADEERHLSWLAEKHDALGGHSRPDAPTS